MALDIILDENFALESEAYNFMLMARSTKGENSKDAGAERRTVVGYYYRLDHALEAYAAKALKGVSSPDLASLAAEVRRVDESVRKAGAAFLEKFPPNNAR